MLDCSEPSTLYIPQQEEQQVDVLILFSAVVVKEEVFVSSCWNEVVYVMDEINNNLSRSFLRPGLVPHIKVCQEFLL